MYSQNKEEHYILNHFKGQTGRFLDIGAYDGVGLSNTRALAELGWDGVCIEPNPEVFEALCKNYSDNKKVLCYEYAVGQVSGWQNMNMNDTYYSTLSNEEVKRWVTDSTIQYESKTVEVKTFADFYKENQGTFEFISIDAEGVDYEILEQIDLTEIGCKMICIETNGIETQKYIDYCVFYGFKVLHINPENLIMIL